MVIDHAGEVLCTQECVFEDLVKLKGMGKAKYKGGGKQRKNDATQKTWRLQPDGKQMITWTCDWKFQVLLSEENYQSLFKMPMSIGRHVLRNCSYPAKPKIPTSLPWGWIAAFSVCFQLKVNLWRILLPSTCYNVRRLDLLSWNQLLSLPCKTLSYML